MRTPLDFGSHFDTRMAATLKRQAFLLRRQGPPTPFDCYLQGVRSIKKHISGGKQKKRGLFIALAAEVAASRTNSTQDGHTPDAQHFLGPF